MIALGLKSLFQEPLKMLAAMGAITFAVGLVTIEVGMLLGLVTNASVLVDRSRADLWVSAPHIKTFDFATPIEQRKKFLIFAVPGVAKVEEFNISVTTWKMPDGRVANCQAVAFEPDGDLAPALPLVRGSLDSLNNLDAVVIDTSSLPSLAYPALGQQAEIIDARATVAGYCHGFPSFSTMPYVFTSIRRGAKFGFATRDVDGRGGNRSVYFLVGVRKGFDVEAVGQAVQRSVPDVEAHTRAGLSSRTRQYWMVETGIGVGFLFTALVGAIAGGVMVSQTLYALTVARLPELAVLKAMGASSGELALMVLAQALFCGSAGLLAGLALSFLARWSAPALGTGILIPWPLLAAVALLAWALSSASCVFSVAKLAWVEPVCAFRA